jgi:anaerobic magnesium-protoporphyrin IX monomethyl ester cyclase
MMPLSTGTGPVLIPPAEPGTTVLLIHSPYPAKPRFDGLPSSLLSASARLIEHLAERGVAVGLMDPGTTSEGFYEGLERVLRAGSVRVVCISTSTAAIEETARIVWTIRSVLGSSPLIVVGGPHEDACRLKVAEAMEGVDVSVAGDGEFVLLALVRKYLSNSSSDRAVADMLGALGVDQVALRGRGTITSRCWGQPISRAFDFGPTDVESFHTRCHVARPVRFDVFAQRQAVPLMISRGCSYGRCTFCSEGGPGVKSQVVRDFGWARELSQRHPDVPLYFQDSIFPATRRVRDDLLPLLGNLGSEWGCQVYLPTLSRKLVADLAQHGCTYLYTGIESGSDDVLQSIGKTGLTRELILERLGWFAEHGVRAGLSLMFGAMSEDGQLAETTTSVADTVSLARELVERGVPIAGFYPNIQTVLPGTALDHGLAARGLDLDFYTMPRAPEFAEFEDGAVGYNFMTLNRETSPEQIALAEKIIVAAQELESPGANNGRDGISTRNRTDRTRSSASVPSLAQGAPAST